MPAQPSALSATSQWIPWLISGAISNKGAGQFSFTSAEPGQHRLQAVLAGDVIAEAVTGDAVRTAILTGLPLNSSPTIQVRSENGGLSSWRTLALTVPAMPTNAADILVPSGLTADTSDPARVVISWTDNANNESDYELFVRGPGNFAHTYFADAPATSITVPVIPGITNNVGAAYLIFGSTYVVQIAARGGKYKLRTFSPLVTALSAEVQFATADPQIVLTNLPAHAAAWHAIAFSFQIETSETPTSFAISSGALPSGITLDTGTGLVSGTPTDVAGTYRAHLRADNATGHDIAQLEIQLATPSFSVRLPSGLYLTGLNEDLGAAFTQSLVAVAFGPIAAVNAWTLDQGPDWLSIDAATGELSGTPAASGTYTCQLTAGNGTQSNPWVFAIVVLGVRITSADHLTVFTGQAFSFSITASPDGCTFTSGDLPTGVTLTGNVLAGTVVTAGDYEIDLGAYLASEGVSQAFTLHVLPLVTIDDGWEMILGQPQLRMLQWNGASHVNQWFLTAAPPGLVIDFASSMTGPSSYTPRAKVSGIPTASGIYDAEITAQIVDSTELFRIPIRISVSGGLFLAWYHKDASRREVQLLLRSMKVDGYYFDAGNLILVRGDPFTLHVILRDGPIHGDELGLATVEAGLTDLKLMIRPKDDWDAEPWIEVGGAVTTAAIGDRTVFVLTFTPGGPETEIEKVLKSINESPGADPTEAKLEGMGEIVATLNGNVLTSLPFGVVIRQTRSLTPFVDTRRDGVTKTFLSFLTLALAVAVPASAADNASTFSMGLNRVQATDTTTHQIEIDTGTKLHFQNNADRTAFALELGSGAPGNVTSVNSFTGAVVLGAGDVGLGNVENTALSTWPGSTAITSVGTLTLGTASTGFTIQLGNVTLSGTLSGSKVSGGTFGAVNGSALTTLNASNISSGTLNDSRLAADVWRNGQTYSGLDSTTIFGGTLGHPMRIYMSDYGILAINTQFAQFEINPLAVITQAANPIPDYNVWVSGTGGKLAPIANSSTGKFFGAHTGAAPSWDNVTDALLSTSDVTTNNADASKHGFLRKLDNNAAHYLDGTGAWSSPSAGGWSRVSGSDFTNATSTLNPVTGLSFAIGASEVWHAEVAMSVIGGTSGVGLKFNVTAPAGATGLVLITGTGTSGSTQMENEVQASFGATPTKNFAAGSSLAGIVRMDITVINSTTAGNVAVQMALLSPSGTGTVKVNSKIVYAK